MTDWPEIVWTDDETVCRDQYGDEVVRVGASWIANVHTEPGLRTFHGAKGKPCRFRSPDAAKVAVATYRNFPELNSRHLA